MGEIEVETQKTCVLCGGGHPEICRTQNEHNYAGKNIQYWKLKDFLALFTAESVFFLFTSRAYKLSLQTSLGRTEDT